LKVRPKKHLGQHFLKDNNIARQIAVALRFHEGYKDIIEVGPGTGMLTQYLLPHARHLRLVEIDPESVRYLQSHFPELQVLEGDFLKWDIGSVIRDQFGVIGNFPYNISSQIFFKVLDYKASIPEVVGMVQKEVGERICADEGSKTYGILSVLLGAFYEREVLFDVSKNVFDPPPAVESVVIRLSRKKNFSIPCSEKLFFRIVKQAFQLRRKTLRNALKAINLPEEIRALEILNNRPEQLSIAEFIDLTTKIERTWKP